MQQSTQEVVKHGLDFASIGVVLGTISQVLPAIAALLTIIWTGFRIYEMKTVQCWLKKRK